MGTLSPSNWSTLAAAATTVGGRVHCSLGASRMFGFSPLLLLASRLISITPDVLLDAADGDRFIRVAVRGVSLHLCQQVLRVRPRRLELLLHVGQCGSSVLVADQPDQRHNCVTAERRQHLEKVSLGLAAPECEHLLDSRTQFTSSRAWRVIASRAARRRWRCRSLSVLVMGSSPSARQSIIDPTRGLSQPAFRSALIASQAARARSAAAARCWSSSPRPAGASFSSAMRVSRSRTA